MGQSGSATPKGRVAWAVLVALLLAASASGILHSHVRGGDPACHFCHPTHGVTGPIAQSGERTPLAECRVAHGEVRLVELQPPCLSGITRAPPA